MRGSNKLVLEEADRSLHDALCVVRCLVQQPFVIAGGGAPEIELSRQLGEWAKGLHGMESYCVRAFAEALEVIPPPGRGRGASAFRGSRLGEGAGVVRGPTELSSHTKHSPAVPR